MRTSAASLCSWPTAMLLSRARQAGHRLARRSALHAARPSRPMRASISCTTMPTHRAAAPAHEYSIDAAAATALEGTPGKSTPTGAAGGRHVAGRRPNANDDGGGDGDPGAAAVFASSPARRSHAPCTAGHRWCSNEPLSGAAGVASARSLTLPSRCSCRVARVQAT